ncbi:energy-coupling factor ABC transporter ATP-binding protein [Acetobacterium bakii]|uniref:energy-coupling factor ABC transporter ATP-binding protein n=1 Tax=Acetobacterium bakii TaxID=52689 RepID=UPI00067FEF82|nr:energy-coupling factor ABC transporter ATP-binding protein [Acetobacterium bakii]
MIKTENLTYQYPDGTKALKNVSVDGDRGNCIALIGENGAGKSTLMSALIGLIKPSEGGVFFKGEPLSYKKKDLYAFRKYIGLVIQESDKQVFYSGIYDDIAFALRNLGMDADEIDNRVKAAMKDTGITDIAERPVHYLSYGQKKRVAMAGVLAMKPGIILMDEPTLGLDPKSKAGVKNIIREALENGIKIILSSHDMDFIYEFCDYTYVLHHGQVLCEGETTLVFKNKEALETASLEEATMTRLERSLGIKGFRSIAALEAAVENQRKEVLANETGSSRN